MEKPVGNGGDCLSVLFCALVGGMVGPSVAEHLLERAYALLNVCKFGVPFRAGHVVFWLR